MFRVRAGLPNLAKPRQLTTCQSCLYLIIGQQSRLGTPRRDRLRDHNRKRCDGLYLIASGQKQQCIVDVLSKVFNKAWHARGRGRTVSSNFRWAGPSLWSCACKWYIGANSCWAAERPTTIVTGDFQVGVTSKSGCCHPGTFETW